MSSNAGQNTADARSGAGSKTNQGTNTGHDSNTKQSSKPAPGTSWLKDKTPPPSLTPDKPHFGPNSRANELIEDASR
jgi:hypothetical protein